MRQPAMRVLTWAVLAIWSTAALAQSLTSDIQRIIKSHDLKGGVVAVSVRDAETDQPIVSVNEDRPMIPASNMKVLTSGAALHILGRDFEFKSHMRLRGDQLVIVGDGDPGFADPELLALLVVGERQGVTVEEFLNLWVQPIVKAGITNLREIVVDDRVFDREFIHDSWPRDQLNQRYCAEVSGFMFHLNVLAFYPRPVPGQHADVSKFEPYAPWIPIENRMTSNTGRNAEHIIGIARPFRTNNLTIWGNVKVESTQPSWVTVHNGPAFFARLLADRLRQAGVRVETHRVAGDGEDLTGGETIGPVVRTPLGSALVRCNTDSYNLYAESLLKRAGHAVTNGQPGSFANGAAAIRLAMSERLNDPAITTPIIIADGSGMSRENRITASFMTRWLNSFARDPEVSDMFLASLAVGGSSGTLSSRFDSRSLHGATVHAKTGYINAVSCLSGYVTMPDGRRRTFSILTNDLTAPGMVGVAKRLQEAVVEAIARDMARQPVEMGG